MNYLEQQITQQQAHLMTLAQTAQALHGDRPELYAAIMDADRALDKAFALACDTDYATAVALTE